jgi:hypothetical protein
VRWVCLAAAAALFAGPAAAWPGDPKPPRLTSNSWPEIKAWIDAHIDLDGWITVNGVKQAYWFVSSVPTSAPDYPIVRDWVRVEHSDDGIVRSSLFRIEVDCADSRQRILESYNYRDNNLRGPFRPMPHVKEELKATTSGSVMSSVVDAICRGARR